MSDLNPYQAPVTDSEIESSVGLEHPATAFEKLGKVRTGLNLIYNGIVAILLVSIGSPLLLFLLGFIGAAGSSLMIVLGTTLVMLVSSITVFVGHLLCTAVPRETKARDLAITAVSLQVLGVVISVSTTVLSIYIGVAGMNAIASVSSIVAIANFLGVMLAFVSVIIFARFLKRLNQFLGNEELAKSSGITIKLTMLVPVLYAVFNFLSFLTPLLRGGPFDPGFSIAMMAVGAILVLLAIVTFIRYANLIGYTAKQIKEMAN